VLRKILAQKTLTVYLCCVLPSYHEVQPAFSSQDHGHSTDHLRTHFCKTMRVLAALQGINRHVQKCTSSNIQKGQTRATQLYNTDTD
jgi:hypothetical protein